MVGVLGLVMNIILVMNMIYFFFNLVYVEIIGKVGIVVYLVIIVMIFSFGVLEVFVVGVVVLVIVSVLFCLMKWNVM